MFISHESYYRFNVNSAFRSELQGESRSTKCVPVRATHTHTPVHIHKFTYTYTHTQINTYAHKIFTWNSATEDPQKLPQ
jgi:hypothetical protein